MPQLEHGRIVNFGGIEFRVEVVSPTYTKLIPTKDPDWILRHCETVAKKEKS